MTTRVEQRDRRPSGTSSHSSDQRRRRSAHCARALRASARVADCPARGPPPDREQQDAEPDQREQRRRSRLCDRTDRPRSARNQCSRWPPAYQPTVSGQPEIPVPRRGRAHRQDAEPLGARRQDEPQQDRGQPDHDHDQQAAGDQAVQQRRPVEQQEGAERAQRERGDPAEAEREPAADRAQARLRPCPAAWRSGAGGSRWSRASRAAPTSEPRPRNTRDQQEASTRRPAPRSRRRAAPRSGAQLGQGGRHGCERGQDVLADRHRRGGHVAAIVGAARGRRRGGRRGAPRAAAPASARTVGIVDAASSSSRTLPAGRRPSTPAACARTAAGASEQQRPGRAVPAMRCRIPASLIDVPRLRRSACARVLTSTARSICICRGARRLRGCDPAITRCRAAANRLRTRLRRVGLSGMGACVICHTPRGRRMTRRVPAPQNVSPISQQVGEATSACQHHGIGGGQPLRQRPVRSCAGARRAWSRPAPTWRRCSRRSARATISPGCCAARSSAARSMPAPPLPWPSALGASDDRPQLPGRAGRASAGLAALPAIIDRVRAPAGRASRRGDRRGDLGRAAGRGAARRACATRSRAMPAGPVQLTAAVDPSLLGGMVVRIGSRMVDASLKTKLHNLELSMRGIR